jgi:Tol biopolymer transport system component
MLMKTYKTALIAAAATVAAVFLLAPLPGFGQSEAEKAKARADQRAKGIALARETGAQILTMYDRQGKLVDLVEERDFYNQPTISPDKTRIAVIKNHPETETQDAWVIDVASGKGTRITTASQRRDLTRAPVWSPDGTQLAYVSLRGGTEGLYRKAANGEGPEELLYKHAGFGMNLMGWSLDGRYLSYFTTDLSGGILYLLPLEGTGERKPLEAFRSTNTVQGARLSPDSRFISYMSNQSGRPEMYVRPVDASGQGAASGGPWQISADGGLGMGFWRQDGKEFYYLAADRGFMAVDVSASATFEFGKPRLLFRLPEALGVSVGTVSVSRDGERFVVAAPAVPRLSQITVFDRQGKVLNRIGEPGSYAQASLSPDGTRVVTMRNDSRTNQLDIWTFEVATGKAYPVTNDNEAQNAPIWSPDGKQVAYVSTTQRGMPSIYRKAWDGSGTAEQLFTYTPGAGMVLTDWSPDGKFMAFWTQILVLVPLDGQNAAERKGIEWLREEYNVLHGRFSPDMRHIAYITDQEENGKLQLYVRPFDASKPDGPPAGAVVQISADASGMIGWRQDGREMYFLQPDPKNTDIHVMTVDVTSTPTFKVGTPRLLFKVPGPVAGNSLQWESASSDGQRFVFAVSVPSPAR